MAKNRTNLRQIGAATAPEDSLCLCIGRADNLVVNAAGLDRVDQIDQRQARGDRGVLINYIVNNQFRSCYI